MFSGTDLGLQISAGHHLKTKAILDQKDENHTTFYMAGSREKKVLYFAIFIQILRTQYILSFILPNPNII